MLENWDLDLEQSTQKRNEIKQKASALLAFVYTWKQGWEKDPRNSYSTTSSNTADLPTTHDTETSEIQSPDSPPFLTTYLFPSRAQGTTLMFVNTTLIYLLRILASLPDDIPGQYPNQTVDDGLQDIEATSRKLGRSEYSAWERLAALEVYRCIPFDLDQTKASSFCSSPVGHWAVATAWATLGGGESPQGKWMTNLLNSYGRQAVAKALYT